MAALPHPKAGDPYACPRCHVPHVMDQPYRDRSTAERTHLYVTCQGQRYFVGQAVDDRTVAYTGGQT